MDVDGGGFPTRNGGGAGAGLSAGVHDGVGVRSHVAGGACARTGRRRGGGIGAQRPVAEPELPLQSCPQRYDVAAADALGRAGAALALRQLCLGVHAEPAAVRRGGVCAVPRGARACRSGRLDAEARSPGACRAPVTGVHRRAVRAASPGIDAVAGALVARGRAPQRALCRGGAGHAHGSTGDRGACARGAGAGDRGAGPAARRAQCAKGDCRAGAGRQFACALAGISPGRAGGGGTRFVRVATTGAGEQSGIAGPAPPA
ncbi:Uncharacterised protein [Achromobacter xylosoxidans]|nr:Uncharacterised protein [Achromobacter xylosoxidans]